MPELKDLHCLPVFLDLVVNRYRAVHELAHARTLSDRAAHSGEAAEQIDVIK